MSDDSAEDRAKKLRGRFSTPDPDETSDSPATDEASDTSPASETDQAPTTPDTSTASDASNTPSTQETTPLRDRPTKLLYLEEELKDDLELAFDELNLRYKRDRGEELQENNDWWPVLLRIGYEAIGDVRDVDLEEFDRAREGEFSVRDADGS